MRISSQGAIDGLRTAIATDYQRLNQVGAELSTGQRINLPSDDPGGAGAAMQYTSAVALDGQLTSSIDTASSRLSAADAALGSLANVVQSARGLAVQAGAGTLSQSNLDSMTAQLNQLIQEAVQIGNTSASGQYVFAGTKTTAAPFSAADSVPTTVTYQGDSNPIEVSLGGSTSVRVDVPGDSAVQPVIQAMIQLRNSLQTGDTTTAISTGLQGIDAAISGLTNVQASVGARENQLSDTATLVAADSTRLQTLQSSISDTDVADATVRLSEASTVYQASLEATSKALQYTLADFLQ